MTPVAGYLPFHVVPGRVAETILGDSRQAVLRAVRDAYLLHGRHRTVNPDSYFLRFPDKPESRVIALPAYLGGAVDRIGIKWISSFPGNVPQGMARASAVLILNDYATGYPIACLEAAGISAARTAASAVLAVDHLPGGASARSVAFVGGGVIARTISDYLFDDGRKIPDVRCHDVDDASARLLAGHVAERSGADPQVVPLEAAMDADLVIFATTAAAPHVPADYAPRPEQLLLNISLRDLPPEVLLRADNVVDDVEHCLKAQTSPHLAEQLTGNREFVTATLPQVLAGPVALDPRKPTIFSPFGLGVLDIAVGSLVLDEALRRSAAVLISDFVSPHRW